MIYKAVIVEDELHSLERLKTLLTEFEEIEIIGEAMDGESAVEIIDTLKPDILFLDIQLPVYNGFEILERVKHRASVIFVTSYNQYAIKAFEENAIDYLLKPTSKERLRKSIERIKADKSETDNKLMRLLKSKIFPEFLTRISIKVNDDIILIPIENIYYFKAENKYVFLGTFDKEYICNMTLKELDEILDPQKFVRVSKSHIVSIGNIHKFSKWFLGDYFLKLNDQNKTQIKIGRTYLPNVRDVFKF